MFGMRRETRAFFVRAAVIVVLTSALFFGAYRLWREGHSGLAVPTTSGYVALFMENGQILYGKLKGLGTDWPIMEDVYYIRTQVDQGAKTVDSKLIKRGGEWHSPDRMYVNSAHILFVEPVAAKSRVMELISGMKTLGN